MSFVKWKAQRRLYFPKECDCKCQDESGGPSERNCYTSPWVTLHESSPSSFTPTHDLYTILHLSSTPKSTVYIRLDQTLPQIWCPCICDKSQTTPLDEVQMKKRSPFLLKVPHPPFNHKSLTFFLTISEHYQTQRFLLFVLRCTSNLKYVFLFVDVGVVFLFWSVLTVIFHYSSSAVEQSRVWVLLL